MLIRAYDILLHIKSFITILLNSSIQTIFMTNEKINAGSNLPQEVVYAKHGEEQKKEAASIS